METSKDLEKYLRTDVLLNEYLKSNFLIELNHGKINPHSKIEYDNQKLQTYLPLLKDNAKLISEKYDKNNKFEFEGTFLKKWLIGGNPTLYNSSPLLDMYSGIPYLPGKAIRGAIRNYYITQFYENDENAALNDNNDAKKQGFLKLFGTSADGIETEDQKNGALVFYDAYPTEMGTMELDVKTPHFQDWYISSDNAIAKKNSLAENVSEKEKSIGIMPPADFLDPIPIIYRIFRGFKFEILIGIKNGYKTSNFTTFEQNLQAALRMNGLGSNRGINYGRVNFSVKK